MINRFWNDLKENWTAILVLIWLAVAVIFGLVEAFGRFLLWITIIKNYFA